MQAGCLRLYRMLLRGCASRSANGSVERVVKTADVSLIDQPLGATHWVLFHREGLFRVGAGGAGVLACRTSSATLW